MAAVLFVTSTRQKPASTAEAASFDKLRMSAHGERVQPCVLCGRTLSPVRELAKSFTSSPDLYHSKTRRHKPNSRAYDDLHAWPSRSHGADSEGRHPGGGECLRYPVRCVAAGRN